MALTETTLQGLTVVLGCNPKTLKMQAIFNNPTDLHFNSSVIVEMNFNVGVEGVCKMSDGWGYKSLDGTSHPSSHQ